MIFRVQLSRYQWHLFKLLARAALSVVLQNFLQQPESENGKQGARLPLEDRKNKKYTIR